ncbi:MAG TPA: hypothetical protein PK029_04285 [Bacteroidales bacterium]|nr:hypothetical protein [Bacteroidales bacterium]
MNVKSVIVGALLVIVGVVLGYVISSQSCCPLKKGGMPCSPPMGQFDGPHGHNFDKHKGGMQLFSPEFLDEIKATDEQKKQITEILDKKREEMKAHREQMKAERDKVHAQIMQVLNDEQKAVVEQRMKDRSCKKDSTRNCKKVQ